MTDLMVIGFDRERQAMQAMKLVRQMAVDGLLDVEDMTVVALDENGEATCHSEVWQPDAGTGAALGGALGLFVGALLIPLTGGTSAAVAGTMAGSTLTGAAAGVTAGGLSHDDLDMEFTMLAQALLQPGTAALVIQVDHVLTDEDRLLAHLPPIRGKVLQTTLDPAAEAKLRAALGGTAAGHGTASGSTLTRGEPIGEEAR
jgi:uncharacterized membrane protein